MEQFKQKLDRVVGGSCVVIMGFLTIDVLYQVATRLLSRIELLGP